MVRKNRNYIQKNGYAEAMRYMANAKEDLLKAGQNGRYYTDRKYVRTACGTAYNGVLVALESFFEIKKVNLPKIRKSIDYYRQGLRDHQKVRDALNSAYDILHLSGYYDGILDSDVVKIGFARAKEIINHIKPQPEAV
ncbi:MAG: DUF5618 family protein [Fibromonadaceae bacterium]|nr:DUF5618 family protein [Fibromonadaceae bacterium]